MYLAWTIIYYSVLGLTTVIIPLANFYYESDEDKPFVAHHLYIHKLSRMCMTLF
jgi:LMBR1 domain-containing protein 1